MGTEIAYMFDDESYMGGWTKDFDKIFLERNGYDVTDFMPYLSKTYNAPSIAPTTEKQYRARSDYFDKHLPKDVGPYHANMVIAEAREGAGGLFGPITIERNINA